VTEKSFNAIPSPWNTNHPGRHGVDLDGVTVLGDHDGGGMVTQRENVVNRACVVMEEYLLAGIVVRVSEKRTARQRVLPSVRG